MNRHIESLEEIEKRLTSYPDSYPPEPLLRNKKKRYRYYHSPKSKRVYVVRLWDMRRDPDLMVRNLK